MTGEAVSTTIEQAILDYNLDPSLLRGQAYDEASIMSGRYKGCAAITQKKYPKALYSHCWSQNLAMVKVCDSIQVRNLFAVMIKVYQFFDNHLKCQHVLDKFCKDSKSELKSMSKTRWVHRIDVFHTFMDLFDSVVKSFTVLLDTTEERLFIYSKNKRGPST